MILLGLGLLSLLLYVFFRRQDRRMLRNGVALVVGVLLVLAGTLDLLWEEVPALQWLLAKAVLLALAGMLLLGVFLIFLTYAVIYGRTRHRARPAAVVVLGCQLIEGRVPPLLASRLDRALEIYRQTQDPKPLLIPSGGQVRVPQRGGSLRRARLTALRGLSGRSDGECSGGLVRVISSAAPRRPSKDARPAERWHGCP